MHSTSVLWHNPRCSKSREALTLLRARGVEPEIRLYLQQPPTLDELRQVAGALDRPISDWIRFNEPLARQLGLHPQQTRSDEDWLSLLAAHPSLIERPLLLHAGRAALGRPPSQVLRLFGP